MKLSDVVFKTEDCCGNHESATVTLNDGRVVGILKSEGIYTLQYYSDAGLIGREVHVTADRVSEVIQ